jgi:peptidyl-prolyl cis-trans isomerase D
MGAAPAAVGDAMYDFVYKNKRLMQVILALIVLPFAFFGIDSYFTAGRGGDSVAVVGDYKITQGEFAEALKDRQESLQRMAGGRADRELLDGSELRFSVVDNLIQQRLLLDRAIRSGLVVTDRQIQDMVGAIDAFKEEGKFSYARYEALLKAQGMTPVVFEGRVRQDLLTEHVLHPFSNAAFVSRSEAALLLRISEQQREISVFELPADRYVAQVKLEPDAVRKYYDGHPDEFRIPEQVRVEFVVLAAEALLAQMQPAAADVRRVYDENMKRYEVKESRQAAHILIAADGGADERKKARARAEEILAQAKKNPKDFPALAKQHSQDPGSAAKGGDLGFFERGSMVKAFDDAVFSMKQGDISGLVETEFGFHIIRLASVRGGKAKSFEEARAEIEAELKKQMAQRRFAELSEGFSNTLFEQSDSLKAAAELIKAVPQKSGWITRNSADNPLVSNPKLLQAIFSDDVLNNKRNTEAIEIAPGILVGARIAEHRPSALQPFEQVSAGLTRKLTTQQAAQLAAQEGRARLAALREGKDAQPAWSAPRMVSRADSGNIPVPILRQAFKTDASSLPAFAGVEAPSGAYILIRVSKVQEAAEVAKDKQNAIGQTLRQVIAQSEASAYLASLRKSADVKIRKDAVERKQ